MPSSVADADHGASRPAHAQQARPTTLADCALPLRLEVHGERVEIDTQVQIYATNAQLCHPLVSPALGYLGGLCPLFVMCGDNEVLRDEIIYLCVLFIQCQLLKPFNPSGTS
jgi:acetyl esterase/lipase